MVMMRSHSCSVVSIRSSRDSTPTLLCRMSSPPQRATARSTMALQSAARVTSAANASAVPFSFSICATVSCARAISASAQRTLAPSRAKRIAVALPLPIPGPREPAPVTIATLSFRRPAIAPREEEDSRRARRRCARRGPPWRSPALRGFGRLGLGLFLGFLVGFLLGFLLFLFGLAGFFGLLAAVHQRDQRQRRIVALAEAGLEDAQIAAIALGVARPQVAEQLLDDAAVAQSVEGQPAVGERGLLAERDHRFHHAPQLLRLGQRGGDLLVPQERDRHIAEHRQPVAGRATELSKTVTVPHARTCAPDRRAASSRASCRA